MTLPLVSVAIPAYNHAVFIEACLASVCAQTYPELEIIIVDDGSTDDTFEMARKFLELHRDRFRRIVLERQENRGVSATSNRVVAAAQGEWVHLLGSDDLMYPNKVERIQKAIADWNCPELALVHADVDIVDATGRPSVSKRKPKKRPAPGVDRDAWRWLFFNQQYIYNPTVTLRRDAFLAMGGFDEHLPLEDLYGWLRLSLDHAIARVPEILAGYRKHGENTSRTKKLKMLAALLRTYANFLEISAGRFSDAEIRKHFRMNLRHVLRRLRSLRPVWWPIAAQAWAGSFVRTPGVEDYRRFASMIEQLDREGVRC